MTAAIYSDGNKHLMAYVRGEPIPWHGLGTALPHDAALSDWLAASGLDVQVLEAPLQYRPEGTEQIVEDPRMRVLYRSDNNGYLATVTPTYKIVQPSEIGQFFQDACSEHGWSMCTMGTLGENGARYWALARTGPDATVANDEYAPYALITTSADCSLATHVRFTLIRVVCQNTLTMALMGKRGIRVKHTSAFDSREALRSLGIATDHAIAETLDDIAAKLATLREFEIDQHEAARTFAELLTGATLEDRAATSLDQLLAGAARFSDRKTTRYDDRKPRRIRGYSDLWDSYLAAPGADPGTGYGMVQGLTHWLTHERGSSDASRMASALAGQGADMPHTLISDLLQRAA